MKKIIMAVIVMCALQTYATANIHPGHKAKKKTGKEATCCHKPGCSSPVCPPGCK
ncbi:MAG TPA: hypothetical protein VNE41_11085 [Chitinophagaceae bacterium]|nr:hypothetical protein [Chitinophagaceae bacterium]